MPFKNIFSTFESFHAKINHKDMTMEKLHYEEPVVETLDLRFEMSILSPNIDSGSGQEEGDEY